MGDECRRVKKQSRNLELKLNRLKNLGKYDTDCNIILDFYRWECSWPRCVVQLANTSPYYRN